jgi:hypothetical protein
MPSQYLFTVNSRPTGCDEATWEKWYAEEHIPDLVGNKASTRASIYRETSDVPSLYKGNAEQPYSRKYLALYQTDFDELLKSEGYNGVRKTSELFPGSKVINENAEFDARNYKLVDVFDPKGLGDSKHGVNDLIYVCCDLTPFYSTSTSRFMGRTGVRRRRSSQEILQRRALPAARKSAWLQARTPISDWA